MTISRSGPVPPFYEYVCGHALIPYSNPPSSQLLALLGGGQDAKWIDIPSFQRGISWEIENVLDFLESNSILLGNAILSQHPVNPGQFQHLPQDQKHYLVLVDGLQRLAVGTAILVAIHGQVLSPTPSRPADAQHFLALAARVHPLSAYFFHNDVEFLNHPRQAIRDQYAALRLAVKEYCDTEIAAGRSVSLAARIVPLFMRRQVALDVYFNFNRQELLATFIGINTMRVELGPVDLLRASIIEKATTANWTQVDQEAIENDFTATLTDDQKPKQQYLPFINAALKIIEQGKGHRLFPSWNTGLMKAEVDAFLDFITTLESSISTNAYLTEIALCGKLPVSTVLGYFYIDLLHGTKSQPPFFAGLNSADDQLHAYLVCCYRLIIDGSIGRTSNMLESILDGSAVGALVNISDQLCQTYLGRPIATDVDQQWLETSLNAIDQKKAARIFNAMLLPARSNLGAPFKPLQFGRASKQFQVDHLIPDSLGTKSAAGAGEMQTLRNFAPLPANQNKVAKATSCSTKLQPNGIYASYCAGASHAVHPYSQWLLTTYTPAGAVALDIQANLEKNSTPDIGTIRITKIASDLLSRI